MNVKDVEKFFKEWGSICRLLTKKDKAIYSHKELLDFAEQYHQSKVNNGVLDDVVYCGCDNPKMDTMDYDNFNCLNCNREIEESCK